MHFYFHMCSQNLLSACFLPDSGLIIPDATNEAATEALPSNKPSVDTGYVTVHTL